ncbi:alpha/beta hydrolase [Thiocapsa sp.]|uniref:alpha/beta fold hydrolase n=1 Tax=Thiocapsa sp. TaxID=2024551 RepID=UPI0025FCB872|nr:alpha/beta hydrolase [Thiocapsa sp.]
MIERVSIDDIEIAYRISGPSRHGVPVLMIMGYGGLMEMWPPTIVETLARTRPVIVFDNRGMGYSTSSDQDYSIARFAADAHALLRALDIERAHVLGWSMGSYIAQELALAHPERVEQLILLSASCGGAEAVWPDEAVWRRLVDMSGTLEERIRRMFENLFPPEWLRETPDPMQVFPPITAPIDDANLLRQADALRAWPGVCPRLSEIVAPTLLMTGTEDVVIPPRNAWIIGERIAGASVIQIKGGGHGFFYQAPEQTARYLAAFLDGEQVHPHPGGF